MISKKLLESVLGFDLISVERRGDFIFYVDTFTEKGKGVNIFELAYRCKEWAVNGGLYKLESATFKNSDTGEIEGTASVGKHHFPQESEPQAVIKACEWIMEQEG